MENKDDFLFWDEMWNVDKITTNKKNEKKITEDITEDITKNIVENQKD
jgi:hypothetical protein|tara:strand:+ start:8194 stop:8337 length:144 start_codon:yes stop_codon:yes gene_type:complete